MAINRFYYSGQNCHNQVLHTPLSQNMTSHSPPPPAPPLPAPPPLPAAAAPPPPARPPTPLSTYSYKQCYICYSILIHSAATGAADDDDKGNANNDNDDETTQTAMIFLLQRYLFEYCN